MTCSICNAQIENDSVFCNFCGSKIELNTSPRQIKLTVGKAPNNDIVIKHPNVSKNHAQFIIDGDVINIEDLNSSNGIYINGRKNIISRVIREDEIRLSTEYVFNWNLLDAAINKKRNITQNETGNNNESHYQLDGSSNKKEDEINNQDNYSEKITENTPINKNLFFIIILLGQIVGLLLYADVFIEKIITNDGLYIGVSLYTIFSALVFLRFIYVAWDSIQIYNVRTTPGKAVGFLFIPVFNFYWIFQVFVGLASDFNNVVIQDHSNSQRIPTELPITICILFFIPIIGTVVNTILLPVYVWKSSDRINNFFVNK